jgi:hypothetical protein
MERLNYNKDIATRLDQGHKLNNAKLKQNCKDSTRVLG